MKNDLISNPNVDISSLLNHINSLEIMNTEFEKLTDNEISVKYVMVKNTPQARNVLEEIGFDAEHYIRTSIYKVEANGVITAFDIAEAAIIGAGAATFDGEKFLPYLVEFNSTRKDEYKLTKDALFLADKEIKYNNEVYDGCLALHFEYSFFNNEGKEVFLHSPDGQPNPGVRFHIDKENGYRAEYDYEDDLYPTKFEGVYANIWKDNMTPVTIPFNDAVNLLKENFLIYDDTDNKPAQSTCYSTRKIMLVDQK